MFSFGGFYYEILIKRFILNFFIRTLRGQYVFFYKCMLGLMTVIAMTSIMVIVSSGQ